MIKHSIPALTLLMLGLATPVMAQADSLSLPSGANIAVQVIDTVILDDAEPRKADVLLKPTASDTGDYDLPSHCLITADARLDGERVRLTAKTLTCIEASGDDSEIFTGELSASAVDLDGNGGVEACSDTTGGGNQCQSAELTPEHPFQLRLGRELSLEPQANPSAQINERRRQANGEGIANPIPSERPDPDDQ